MNIPIDPLFASTKEQIKAIQTLATFGFTGTDRFAQLNVYAGLAALDNSAHHFSTLVRSKDLDEVVELQMQALLPAAESAKVYARQVFAFAAITSLELDHVIENQMSRIQDKVYEALDNGLSGAEENGVLAAGIFKDTLRVTREATLSAQSSIKKAMYDSLNFRGTKAPDDVTDVCAKPPKNGGKSSSSV